MNPDIHNLPVLGPDLPLPPHVPSGRSRWRWIGLAVILLGAGTTAFSASRRARPREAPPSPPRIGVTAAPARKGDVGVYLEAIGTVTPVYTALVTSQVTGMVVGVHFREGQRVAKGDPLVDIDARLYRATLAQAEGALERDLHLLAQARMDLERYRAAWASHAIAKQTLEDQQKLVEQDTGIVAADQGTVDYDRTQVAFCHITSPIEGVAGLRLVDPGNTVQAAGSATLVVVTQVTPITVVFTISQDNLGAVRTKLRDGAELGVDALDRNGLTKLAAGKLIALDNQIDTTTGTVKARALFENGDDALFPNEFVNARLLVDTLRGVTLVPAGAIQQNGAQSFVYVIQNGVAHLRTVKAGVTDRGATQVDGVEPGEEVIGSNFDRLRDGGDVQVSNPPPAALADGGAAP